MRGLGKGFRHTTHVERALELRALRAAKTDALPRSRVSILRRRGRGSELPSLVRLREHAGRDLTTDDVLRNDSCRSMQLFRYGAFPLANAVALSDAQNSKLGLEVPPGMAQNYGFTEHEWQRQEKSLDQFRSESFPDDVQVLLPRDDGQVEKMWVRLEAPFPTEEFDGLEGTLLNQPFDPDPFVSLGDHVVLRGYETEDGPVLVLVGRAEIG